MKFNDIFSCLKLSDVEEVCQFPCAYIPLKYFSLFKMKRNEYAGIFFFKNDSTVPCFFSILMLNPYVNEMMINDDKGERLYLINCKLTKLAFENGKLHVEESNFSFHEGEFSNSGEYYGVIIPSFLWRASPLYFSRILASAPRRATACLPDALLAGRFQEVLLEKTKLFLIAKDAPPVFVGQVFEISHHMNSYETQILAIIPDVSIGTEVPFCNYVAELDGELLPLFQFINAAGVFFYASPKSIVVFESEPNVASSLYFKGDACVASGISGEEFNAFLASVQAQLVRKGNPIGFGKRLFCIEGHPGSGKRLLLKSLLKKLPIPFVAFMDCSCWTAFDEIDDIKKTLASILNQAMENRPSIIAVLNFSAKVHPSILVCLKEQLIEKLERIPRIILLFIGGFSDFDLLTHDGMKLVTLSCYQLATHVQRESICDNLLPSHKRELFSKYIADKTHGYLYEDLCKVIELAFGSSFCCQLSFEVDLLEPFASLSIGRSDPFSRIDEALKCVPPSLSHEVGHWIFSNS